MSYGSKLEPQQVRASRILASWPAENDLVNRDGFILSPGTVSYYFSHSVQLRGKYLSHVFACVKWHLPTESSDSIGNPVQVWQSKFREGAQSSFMPVQRLHSRFALATLTGNNAAISPMGRAVFL